MTYCLLPGCFHPENSDDAQYCRTCGTKLWLKDRYRPVQVIGQGGFGRTFLAVDEDLPSHPHCVIKQLCLHNFQASSNQKAMELFYREAEQLDRLGTHAQIPKLLAYCEQDRLLYLVQEWIDGQNLKQELETQGAFTEAQIWELLRSLLLILQFIHQQQVVHRDIKPANIMRRQCDRTLILIDFGIAKIITADQPTLTGTVVGSPEYMAPEQQRGKSLPASDLYSLGATCLYLLTQQSPFDLYDVNCDRWQWQTYLPPGRSISNGLTHILEKLTHPSLSQRYQSVQEVLLDIKRYERSATSRPTAASAASSVASTANRATAPTTAPTIVPPPKLNYKALQKALTASNWEQADLETLNLLCEVTHCRPTQGLTMDDVNHIPCGVLEKLDWLWTRYSRQQFGFSPQVQLYITLDEDYHRFCEQVGWPVASTRTPYLQFNRQAPVGHLPSRNWAGGYHWWQHMQWMCDRFKQCRLL